ncbi:hypothetical protein ACN27F_06805 [Solwaraspora sp. WMMB335]|uniref:hypothetical protein n=1 Tax=Solwaraspora sp. WMMB335 TaxID=3404118 RepID=UPI003B92D6B8
MRAITPADDEVFGLANVAAKLGRVDKVLARIADDHRADPDDPDAACRYALALMATVRADIAAHARFTSAIDAFGRVLAVAPQHWLARYSRARLRALVPSTYGSLSVHAPSELAKAAEDLAVLVAAQADQPPQPYFASAYALAAVVDRLVDGDSTGGRSAHLAALDGCPRRPVRLPALGAILCEPLVTLYAGGGPQAARIGELMAALYGDQSAVVDALRRQPVG